MLDADRLKRLEGQAYFACAAAAAALALVVVVASALIRHVQAGAACPEWPECYGRPNAAYAAATAPLLIAARTIHRASASAVLLLAMVTTAIAWRRRSVNAHELRFSIASLTLALALALLGALGGPSQLPAVVLANLAGGYVLFALLVVSLPTGPGDAFRDVPRALFFCALALLAMQVLLGGLLGAHRSLTTCAAPGSCAWSLSDGLRSDLWTTWQAPTRSIGDNAEVSAFLHSAHRTIGIAVLLAALVCGGTGASSGRALAWIIVGAAAVLPVLGLLAITVPSPLVIVLTHGAAAALLAASLARAALARGASRRSTTPFLPRLMRTSPRQE